MPKLFSEVGAGRKTVLILQRISLIGLAYPPTEALKWTLRKTESGNRLVWWSGKAETLRRDQTLISTTQFFAFTVAHAALNSDALAS